MTSYGRKHRKYHRRSARPSAELLFHPKDTMNDIQLIKYDLLESNYSTIQKMVVQTAAEIRRKHAEVGKGRAQIMAEDYVAANHITGDISGTQLAGWLGNIRAGYRYHKTDAQTSVPEPVLTQDVPTVSTPIQDEDTFAHSVTGRSRVVDPVLAQMVEKCRRIQPGQVWSFPVNGENEARALADYLPKISAALHWRNGRKTRTYLFQIFPDRLKLKRLI